VLSGCPTFALTGFVGDQTVSIITHNLPPKEQFQFTMGVMGTRVIGGDIVGTIDTSTSDAQTFTFAIPVSLYGTAQIAIRLQSVSGSHYYAYNWFYNATTP